jgi:hypothetical protein
VPSDVTTTRFASTLATLPLLFESTTVFESFATLPSVPNPKTGTKHKGTSHGIVNWDKAYGNVAGVRYAYLGACPSELIVLEEKGSTGSWYYFVSNEKNYQNVKKNSLC